MHGKKNDPIAEAGIHPEPLTDPDVNSRFIWLGPHEGCRLPLTIGLLPLSLDPIQRR